jgi:hypothetical protein
VCVQMSAKVEPMRTPSGTSGDRTVVVRIPGKDVKLTEEVQRVLATLDVDGDGEISLPELVGIVRAKENTDADNQRLRMYMFGGFLLYLLTLGCFFGVAFGAGRILKDAFSLGGVPTDSAGRTIAQPTTMYVGEARITSLLPATSEQLSAIKFLTFRLPSDQLYRFEVTSFVATPDPDNEDAWASVELISSTAALIFVNGTSAVLVIPPTGTRDTVTVDLYDFNPWMSVEMAPRPGNYAPLDTDSSSGSSSGGGRRLQTKPQGGQAGQGGQNGARPQSTTSPNTAPDGSKMDAASKPGPPASGSSCSTSMCTSSDRSSDASSKPSGSQGAGGQNGQQQQGSAQGSTCSTGVNSAGCAATDGRNSGSAQQNGQQQNGQNGGQQNGQQQNSQPPQGKGVPPAHA